MALQRSSKLGDFDAPKLASALGRGDRRALARAITLAESTRPEHRAAAEALLAQVLPRTGKALRLGVSGAPGVGKSTFIEAFGRKLVAAGHRLAVLAIDPSGKRGGGAILGDKTRMAELAKSESVFIRPSPSGAILGGVARRTREAILLAEAAGFDRVLVETVGVGQSETAAADIVDIFLVLLQPGGGDELQGIKKGIIELADLVLITKADGELAAPARRAEADYRHALHLLRPADGDALPVMAISALEDRGIDAVLAWVEQRRAACLESGALLRRRADQAQKALWDEIGQGLMEAFLSDAAALGLPELAAQVAAGALTPAIAARAALQAFRRPPRKR